MMLKRSKIKEEQVISTKEEDSIREKATLEINEEVKTVLTEQEEELNRLRRRKTVFFKAAHVNITMIESNDCKPVTDDNGNELDEYQFNDGSITVFTADGKGIATTLQFRTLFVLKEHLQWVACIDESAQPVAQKQGARSMT
jgi:hypothetical protein